MNRPLAIALLFTLAGCAPLARIVGGASSGEPAEMQNRLSPEARRLLERAYADVDRRRLLDYHVHLLGMGENGSGCYVNERMLGWSHPLQRARFLVYKSAARITDESRAETQYLERFEALARGHGGRYLMLAFDQHHNADGRAVPAKSEFYV